MIPFILKTHPGSIDPNRIYVLLYEVNCVSPTGSISSWGKFVISGVTVSG